MTPKEVLAQIRQREVTTVDLRFMDFPGVWQHFSIPADALDRGDVRGRHRLRRLERRRLAGDQRGRPAGRAPARDGADRPVPGAADPDDDLQHPGPDHPPGLHPRPPQHRPQGRQLHAEHRAGRSSACWRPSSSSSSSTTSGSTSAGTRRSITSIRSKGPGTAAGPSSPTWATSRARDWAISPARPPTAWSTSAPRWPSAWPSAASPPRPTSTRSPPAASARST